MFPDPREDPKSRSLNGGSFKVPFSSQGPNQGIYFLDPLGGLGYDKVVTGSAASGHPDVLRSLRVMACARFLPPIADVHLA